MRIIKQFQQYFKIKYHSDVLDLRIWIIQLMSFIIYLEKSSSVHKTAKFHINIILEEN